MGGNTRADIMQALHDGIGGKLVDMAASIMSIPNTLLSDVASAFKLGVPDINMPSIANAIWVR